MNRMIAEVVTAAQSGDESAFEALYNESKNNVYYLGLKMLKNQDDAEDLVQEVFVTVCQKISTLQNPDAYFGWLKQIAANRCKNKLVQKGTVLFSSDDDEADVPEEAEFSEEFLPEKAVENRHLADSVMRLINALAEEQRMVILLFYYEQMKTREIAEALGVSENTVKSRLSYARKYLKAGAEDEERKGNKLYSFSPALLFMLLGEDAIASSASLSLGWGGVTAAAAGSSAVDAAVSQSTVTAAIKAAAATTIKKAGLGLAAKIALGVAAVITIVAGSFAITSLMKQPEPPPAEENPPVESFTGEEAPEDISADSLPVPFDIAGTVWGENPENERQSTITFYDNGLFVFMIYYEENGWLDFPGYIHVYGNYTVSDNTSESDSMKISCKLDRSIFEQIEFTEFFFDTDIAEGTLTLSTDFPLDIMTGGVTFSRLDEPTVESISEMDTDICDVTWLHNGVLNEYIKVSEERAPSLTFYGNGDFCVTNALTEAECETYYGTYRRDGNTIVCTIEAQTMRWVTYERTPTGYEYTAPTEYAVYSPGDDPYASSKNFDSYTFVMEFNPAEKTMTLVGDRSLLSLWGSVIGGDSIFRHTEKHFRFAV